MKQRNYLPRLLNSTRGRRVAWRVSGYPGQAGWHGGCIPPAPFSRFFISLVGTVPLVWRASRLSGRACAYSPLYSSARTFLTAVGLFALGSYPRMYVRKNR